MRHGDKINNLGRTASHRKAMLKNMACSLIQHKNINTTVAKAKALRKFVEPLITKSKADTQHNRRVVFSYLQDKQAVKELFTNVAEKVADRPGGYTRVLKIGLRAGDNAEMAMIELIDFNEFYTPKTKKDSGKKKRSRRGGSGKAKAETKVEEVVAESAVEPATEVVAEAEVIAETAAEEVVEAKAEVIEEVVAEVETPAAPEIKEEEKEDSSDEETPEDKA